MLAHLKEDGNFEELAQYSKGAPHTLNHTAPSPLFSQVSPGDKRPWYFSIWTSQITKSKISYFSSLIEPQPLPCIPACDYEFHAPAVHPHPTFTAPPVGSAFGVLSEVCGGTFLWKQSKC